MFLTALRRRPDPAVDLAHPWMFGQGTRCFASQCQRDVANGEVLFWCAARSSTADILAGDRIAATTERPGIRTRRQQRRSGTIRQQWPYVFREPLDRSQALPIGQVTEPAQQHGFVEPLFHILPQPLRRLLRRADQRALAKHVANIPNSHICSSAEMSPA